MRVINVLVALLATVTFFVLLAQTDADMVAALVDLVSSRERRETIAAHNRATPPPTTWDDVLARCEHAYAAARRLIV